MQIFFGSQWYDIKNEQSFVSLIEQIRLHKIPSRLSLKCKGHNTQDLKDFYVKLSKVAPPLVFAFRLLDDNNNPIYEFEKIKSDEQLKYKIEQLKKSISSKEKSKPKISQHKLYMLARKGKSIPEDILSKDAAKRLTTQRITIPQSQRRVISLSKSEDIKASKSINSEEHAIEISSYSGKTGDLVSFKTLNFIESQYNSIFPHTPRPSLEEIWYAIAGKESNQILDTKDTIITHIHKNVMIDFMRNYSKIKHGVFLDALPVVVDGTGKLIKLVKRQKSSNSSEDIILNYEDYKEQDELNLFSPVFTESVPIFPARLDYEKTFGNSGVHVANSIKQLFSKQQVTTKSDIQILITLAKSKLQDNSEKQHINDCILAFVQIFPNIELLGITDIIITSGIYPLFMVLKLISSMDSKLVEDLLSNRENFVQFASQEGLDKLSALASLDGGDKIWWQGLVNKHKKSGDNVNFFELFALFNDFRSELGISDGALPTTFPFKDLEELNMKSALNIAKNIIQGTKNPMQLHYLDGLGLDLTEAYLASKQGKFRIITKEMGLEVDKTFLGLNYSSAEQDFLSAMNIYNTPSSPEELQIAYNLRCNYFYRFIARNDATSPKRFKYENFLIIEKRIGKLDRKLAINNQKPEEELGYNYKSSLLYIAAVAGTGKGADKQASSPNEEFSKFLNSLRIFSEKFNIDNIEDIIACIHEVGLRVETCPSLSEISDIINKLCASGKENGIKIIEKAIKIINKNGEEAVEIFTNFSEIVSKSKAQNPQVDIADLLDIFTIYDTEKFELDVKPFFAKTLSLFAEPIPENVISTLLSLNSQQQKFFLRKMATIDLNKSNCVLSSENLRQLLVKVHGIENEQELYAAVQGFFIEQGLDIKFSSMGISRSKISLTSALKSLILSYNESYAANRNTIDNYVLMPLSFSMPNAVANIKDGLNEVHMYIQEIEQLLKHEPIDEQALIKIFDKADLRLAYLKDDLIKNGHKDTIKWIGKNVIWAADKNFIDSTQKPYIEAYFNTFSLAVFMDRAIELSVKDTLSTLLTDVFGKEDKKFIDSCMQYISSGSKPVRLGMIKSKVNPSLEANSDAIRELLQNVDGIILYENELYHIQQNQPLSVTKLEVEDAKTEIANKLKSKITEEYKIVGVDGFRVIQLKDIILDSKIALEQALYKHVRTKSLSQDAIISYAGKYYYYDFIAQTVTLKKDSKLSNLFIGEFENREAISSADRELFKDVIGTDKLHDELALISMLGVEPTIFPSQNVEKYNRKLDKFTVVLNKLEALKEKNLKLFEEYFKILKALQEKVSVNDLIDVLDLLMILMPLTDEENDESPSPVLENLKLLFNKIRDITGDSNQSISLSALVSSLRELAKNKETLAENLKDLLQNLIPFALSGTEFPLHIFIKNQNGKDKKFLENLLKAAANLSKSGEKDFFDNLEEIKNKFPELSIEPILSTLLNGLVQDTYKISLYKSIYTTLESIRPEYMQIYVEIFKSLSSLPKTLNLEDINGILSGIKGKEGDLECIYKTFFKFEPYLPHTEFLKALSLGTEEFNDYKKFYVRHPYAVILSCEKKGTKAEHRSNAEINFGIDRVLDVIDGIISLPNNVPLSYTERVNLTKEFAYVNAISKGENKLYLRDSDDNPIEIHGKSSFYLHEYNGNDDVVSREELMAIAQKLKDAFYAAEEKSTSNECLSDPDNKVARRIALQYIAVMREAYYRTTGKVPNSTQIITIINALNNPGKQLEEIETAEGKSVTTALFSALLCAKGCTVLVPTSSKSLVFQDYLDKHNNIFFETLGFKSQIIDQEKNTFELLFGGINYGTSRDIDSLIAEHKIKGISLTVSKEEEEYPLACVKDEQDNDLDDLASRTIAIELPVDKSDLSPTWIISAINKFVQSDNYQNINKKGNLDSDDEEQDIRNLIRYLRAEACSNKDDKIIASQQVDYYLPFLKGYLAIACEVQSYKEGIDYQVIEKDLEGVALKNPVATPINPITSEVERGNTFPDSRQAFLHDLLNESNAYPGRTFVIQIDPVEIDTKSNKALSENFDYFIGLSATSGSKQEILEVGMPVNKIPPHTKKIRNILSPQAVKNENIHNAIINAVRINGYESDLCPTFVLNVFVSFIEICQKTLQLLCYILGKQYTPKDKQPVLIFVKDPVEAKELHDKFSKVNNGYNLQFSNGTETSEEYDAKIKKAGEKNTLTIVVPKDGRGIDYDSDYPEGIFGIKAFNSNLRGGVQVLGRVGRKGKPGKFLEIVDGGEFEYNSLFQRVFGISHQEKKQQIQKREDKLNKDRADERQARQQIDAKIQVVLKQFDKIRLQIQKTGFDDTKLLLLRSKLLRRIKNIENKKQDIKSFEASLIKEWKNFAKQEIAPLVSSFKEQAHPKYLAIKSELDMDIKKQFIFEEIEHHSPHYLKRRIKKISTERTKKILEQNLNGAQAILEFDEAFLDASEKNKIKLSKAARQLKSIFNNYKWLNLRYYESEAKILDNFYNLLNFNYADSPIEGYPVVIDMLVIYEDIKDSIDKEKEDAVFKKIENIKEEFTLAKMNENVCKNLQKQLNFISRGLNLLGIKSIWFHARLTELQRLTNTKDTYAIYKELYKIRTLLENNSSIFPFASYLFGTYDLKKLINETLDNIDFINDLDAQNAQKFNIYSEEGQCAGLFEAYLPENYLRELRNKVPDNMKPQWDSLVDCINKIRDEQPGFAAIDEVLAFLRTQKIETEHYIDGTSVKNSSKSFLYSFVNTIIYVADSEPDPKKCLIKKLEKIQSKVREFEKARIKTKEDSTEVYLTQDKRYLEEKQERLKNNITKLFGEDTGEDSSKIDTLEIFPGYFGNSQGYELRIKYSGDIFGNTTLTGSLGAETEYVCFRGEDAPLITEPEIQDTSVANKAESEEHKQSEKPAKRRGSFFSWNRDPQSKNEQNEKPLSETMPKKSASSLFFGLFSTKPKPSPKKPENDVNLDESRNSDSTSSVGTNEVVVERKNSLPHPELVRQEKLTRVIVKKFNSLTELLEFEIKFLDADDPRHRSVKSENLSAHVPG